MLDLGWVEACPGREPGLRRELEVAVLRPEGEHAEEVAQVVLGVEVWDQSERFDAGWALVAATYHAEVHVLANVIDITPKPERKKRRA